MRRREGFEGISEGCFMSAKFLLVWSWMAQMQVGPFVTADGIVRWKVAEQFRNDGAGERLSGQVYILSRYPMCIHVHSHINIYLQISTAISLSAFAR